MITDTIHLQDMDDDDSKPIVVNVKTMGMSLVSSSSPRKKRAKSSPTKDFTARTVNHVSSRMLEGLPATQNAALCVLEELGRQQRLKGDCCVEDCKQQSLSRDVPGRLPASAPQQETVFKEELIIIESSSIRNSIYFIVIVY